MKRITMLCVAIFGLLYVACASEESDELNCRSDMKHFCKEWIENCDDSRCDEEDYRKNCRPRIVFVCE